jgi:hypothetical protein
MKVDTVFIQDRLGRGGDHSPFQAEGYAAVRFSTPNEIYVNQHHATDTLENMSVPYTAKVARVNAAVAASLAMAPKPPVVMRDLPAAGRDGTNGGETASASPGTGRGTGGRRGPLISRGSGYDAVLQWKAAGPADGIKGYAVVIRPTTSASWEQEIYVGKVNQFTLKDVSIDDAKFGVKAIGVDGSESLVSPYVYPARPKIVIETVQ